MASKNGNDVNDVTLQTYETIAPSYSSRIDDLVSGWIGKYEKELLNTFLAMCKSQDRETRILDIGCGNGRDTHYLMAQDTIVIGADRSLVMLKEAQKHAPNGDFCRMDMRNLSFFGGIFDGIWANGCIYHVSKVDFIKILNEAWRILRPEGIFSFNFKIGQGEGMDNNPKSFNGGPRFYAYYTIEEMAGLLQQEGFEIVEIRNYPKKILDEEIVHVWAMKPSAK